MKRQLKTQAKIKTSGVSKTTPGLGNLPTNIKTPIFADGAWRDPRKFDLVDIQSKKEATEKEINDLSEKAKTMIKEKQDKKKAEELEAYHRKKLEDQAKGEEK